MLKHGIFVKIYFSFWLTIILVLTTQFVLDRVDDSSPLNRMRHHMDSSLDLFGQAALSYHLTGNLAAAAGLTAQFKKTNGIDAYLLDAALNRLDGTPAPQRDRDIASRTLKNNTGEHLVLSGTELMTAPLQAPDGTRYVVIGTFRHRNFMPPPLHFDNPNFTLRLSIILIVSGLGCFLLARYLVAPLVVLREATTRFAAGEHSVRIGSRIGRRKDETTELARDFDEMAERIESLMKLQRQLIGDISHELRSPLARLSVALDLARQNTGPEAEHALNRIEEEAGELNAMIGELLTLTRLESGNEPAAMAPIEIAGLVREIVEDGNFEAQGSNRGVTLTGCEPCFIRGNSDLLRRAIENVVRNAINYTFENTEVEVGITRQKTATVEITVRDHGPGVPESELGTIFRPFYRTSESRERQTGGTGLGLAITERAVTLHNGTVTAENAPGGGLTVHIVIPLLRGGMPVEEVTATL